MYTKKSHIVKKIRTNRRIKRFFTVMCLLAIASGLLSFVFFGLYIKTGAIKFIAKYADNENLKIEKVMTNPRIKFEHAKDDYYRVTAQQAIHKNNNEILLLNVIADGSAANIKAGRLVISENGNDLTFSDNPVLIIKKNPK